MAARRAVISLLNASAPPDAHKPRRREVSEAMAAGIAALMSLAVPACCRRRKSVSSCASFKTLRSLQTHNHGVQPSTGEARSADKVLGCGEFALESRLGFGRAIGES